MLPAEPFAAFVRAHQTELLRLCHALVGDIQSGEDLAQETLRRVWRRSGQLPTDDLWRYTRRVAVNTAIKQRRRRWVGEIPTADLEARGSTPDSAGDVVARDRVTRWLDQLPLRQRAVVVLRFVSDLSVSETADVLGCSVSTVKSQTSKALESLRRYETETVRKDVMP